MSNLHITFRVTVLDTNYGYDSEGRGDSEVKVEVPRKTLEKIDPGNLFIGALEAALVDYDDSLKGENGGKKEEV